MCPAGNLPWLPALALQATDSPQRYATCTLHVSCRAVSSDRSSTSTDGRTGDTRTGRIRLHLSHRPLFEAVKTDINKEPVPACLHPGKQHLQHRLLEPIFTNRSSDKRQSSYKTGLTLSYSVGGSISVVSTNFACFACHSQMAEADCLSWRMGSFPHEGCYHRANLNPHRISRYRENTRIGCPVRRDLVRLVFSPFRQSIRIASNAAKYRSRMPVNDNPSNHE